MNAPLIDKPEAGAAPVVPGRFITFEGGEGAGKSTQVRHLRAHLEQAGIRVIATREPGGSPRAEALRAALLAGKAAELGAFGEAVLFGAARIDHIDTLIRPALAGGAWVICDRFADSTRAYQGAAGNVKPELIAALERVVVGSVKADLTFLLDIEPSLGLARARARAGDAAADRFEGEDLSFHQSLRRAFLDIATREPNRMKVVNAAWPEHEIADEIWALTRRAFPAPLGASAA